MTTLSNKIIIIAIFILLLSAISLYIYLNIYQKSLFDEDSFLKKNYTTSEIDFFSDIAFWNSTWIRKWDTDIKVQMDTINGISDADIRMVDNAIAAIVPLIEPIKISRVSSGGNFIVHLNHLEQTIKGAKGWVVINDMSKPLSINYADVYVMKYYEMCLMHEFLHAIGISHPQNEYPFYTAIGRNTYVVLEAQKAGSKYPTNSIVLNTWDELDSLQSKSHNSLSEQEKMAIKMLYSSDFKSGLTKRYFMNRLKEKSDIY